MRKATRRATRATAGSRAREAPAGEAPLTETQRRILTAALEVFSEHGYAGASTAKIAARAGVAEKTLFAQFKSKGELLARTLRPSVFLLAEPRAFARVGEAIAPEGRSLEGVLGALVTDRLDLAKTHRKKLKLVAHEALLHPEYLADFATMFRERVAPLVAKSAAELAARGELRADLPPQTLVRTVVSVVVGYALTRYVLGFEADLDDEDEIRNVVRLLSEGLRPRGAGEPSPRGARTHARTRKQVP
jgi:AcrR family transcriptional regulator